MSNKQQAAEARKPEEWLIAGKLDFFKKYKGELGYRNYTLGSPQLIRILSRYYEFFSRNLMFIHSEGRALLGVDGEAKIEKAEDVMRQTLEKCKEAINTKIAQAEHLLKEASCSLPTKFNKPVELEVPIVSPNARLFMEILQRADYYMLLNFALWAEGEIDDRNKANNQRTIRKLLLGVINGIRSQFNYIRRQVALNNNERPAATDKPLAKAA
jgi:hypothetical protein